MTTQTLVDFLLVVLMVMPFASAGSTFYLARLVKDAVAPPSLLVMLTATSTVAFICSTYLAALNVNLRFFGNPNPSGLVPITLVVVIAPLAMVNVTAFMLWRVSRGIHRGRLTSEVSDKTRTL